MRITHKINALVFLPKKIINIPFRNEVIIKNYGEVKMSSFTTRVELHDANEANYQQLQEYMEEEGFANIIATRGGDAFKLPPAEYNFVGNVNRIRVLEKAKSAASRTGKKHAVFVTESAGRIWDGLGKV